MNEEKIAEKLDLLVEGQSVQREDMARMRQALEDALKQLQDHHCVLFGTSANDGMRMQLNTLRNAHDARMSLCRENWWTVAWRAIFVNVASNGILMVIAFLLYLFMLHGKA